MELIEVISVPVSDQEISKSFYLSIGFQLIVEAPMGNGSNWVQLGLPGQTTSISLVTWLVKNMPPGALQGLVIKTRDIVKEVEELQSKNIKVNPIDNTPWGKFAEFKDPDGNGLLLREEV